MRLLVRPDMDGIACAVLLSEVEAIDEVVFVEPQVLKIGGIDVRPTDVIANLPWDPRCGMWFDHHISNAPQAGQGFAGRFDVVDSAARVIYDHYRDPRLDRFHDLLEATDRVDAAKLTRDDVLRPEGYILVALTVDPRSGLDNTERYFLDLIDWLKTDTEAQLLARPDVKARCDRILGEHARHEAFLRATSRQEGRCIVTDMRGKVPPAGNRFLVYTLFPDANVAMKVHDATDLPGKVAVSLGHSIFNRTCDVNVGELLARYGGGGHRGAGSSRIDPPDVPRVMDEILSVLR